MQLRDVEQQLADWEAGHFPATKRAVRPKSPGWPNYAQIARDAASSCVDVGHCIPPQEEVDDAVSV